MLTNKGKYGLKAMVYLARLDAGRPAQSSEIATSEHISKKFLDAILLDLRNAGFVRSKKGPGGGYALARDASDIAVGAIVRALDGPLAPIACASRTAYQPCDDCDDLTGCAVRLTMLDVRDAMAKVLDQLSLAEMAARSVVGEMTVPPEVGA
ncbi:MAG: Rrf2 family transcriptional regulator [Phyllobacteriaceae bacterium]|nr:Rrf2 family transcriptional regulator [Phyllobacteriaceae bacterium]